MDFKVSLLVILFLFVFIKDASFIEDITDKVGNVVIHATKDGIEINRIEDEINNKNKTSDREKLIDDSESNEDPNVGINDYGEYEYFPNVSGCI